MYSQEIYDAVRSKIHMPDVETIMRNAFDVSWQVDSIKNEFLNAAYELQRPCVIFKPTLSKDGDHWIAIFGENLQEGVAGCGKSPAEAMYNFDEKWREKLS